MKSRTLPLDLAEPAVPATNVTLGSRSMLLRGFATELAPALLAAIEDIRHISPLRYMVTRQGTMSVAMTNCGEAGWIADRKGYRYDAIDPLTGATWPAMPGVFTDLAARAAAAGGFEAFVPDACLINQYRAGARLALHQDRNEDDYSAPIVSVSLGLPAIFLWGGQQRTDRPTRIPLMHGDVAVWGGVDRLTFHGIHPLADGMHPLTGDVRYNLTFRKAR